MRLRYLLHAGAVACLCPLLLGQTGQVPAGPTSSPAGQQSTPPTFPPGTAHQSTQEQPSSPATKASGKTRMFEGKIAKESTGYTLRVGDLSYKLDDQNQAGEYDGQTVRVFGKLDKETNTIQIQKIERPSSPPS